MSKQENGKSPLSDGDTKINEKNLSNGNRKGATPDGIPKVPMLEEPLPEDLVQFMNTDKEFIENLSGINGDGSVTLEDLKKMMKKDKRPSSPQNSFMNGGGEMNGVAMPFNLGGGGQMPFNLGGGGGQMPFNLGGGGQLPFNLGIGGGQMPIDLGGDRGQMPFSLGGGGGQMPFNLGGGGQMPFNLGGGGQMPFNLGEEDQMRLLEGLRDGQMSDQGLEGYRSNMIFNQGRGEVGRGRGRGQGRNNVSHMNSSMPSVNGYGSGNNSSMVRSQHGNRRIESLPPELAGLDDMSEEDRQAALAILMGSDNSAYEGQTELPPLGHHGHSQRMTGGQHMSSSQLAGKGAGGEDASQRVINQIKTEASLCADAITHGMNTIIILDTSTSMQGDHIKDAVEVVEKYMAGVEDNSMDRGIEENVALVVFGVQAKVLQHLTNDYDKIRDAVGDIRCGGESDIMSALVMTLGMMERGGAFSIGGYVVPSRVIIISDGHLTLSGAATVGDKPQPGTELQVQNEVVGLAQKLAEMTGMKFTFVPIGSPNSDIVSTMVQVTKGEICLAGDARWLGREYLHHCIAAYILSKTNEQLTDRTVVQRLAEGKYRDLTDLDIKAVITLLGNHASHQGGQNNPRLGGIHGGM